MEQIQAPATVTAAHRSTGWDKRHRRSREPQSGTCSHPNNADNQASTRRGQFLGDQIDLGAIPSGSLMMSIPERAGFSGFVARASITGWARISAMHAAEPATYAQSK